MPISRKMFVYRAGLVHRVAYDYSQIPERVIGRVSITCPEHGMFTRRAQEHLQGKGCSVCDAQEKHAQVRAKLIEQARKVHGDLYAYERAGEAKYPVVVITCKVHGDFEQSIYRHLKGSGCPICNPPFYHASKVANKWLDSIGLPNDTKHREVRGLIPGRKFRVDGFDQATNTVYEFYGDEIHGNPALYSPEMHSSLSHTTYGDLYQRTLDKERLIKEAGFKLVTMWASDFNNPLGLAPKEPRPSRDEVAQYLDAFFEENPHLLEF